MAQMDALALEAAEEVFGHGVVIGIALAGHALPDAEAGETLYDALTADRPYRKAVSVECAAQKLLEQAGITLDASIVEPVFGNEANLARLSVA